jgi:hypothetical protein
MIMEFNQWKSSMPVLLMTFLVMLGALNKHITLLVAQQSCWVHHKIQLAEISGAALIKIESDNSGNLVLLSDIHAVAGRSDHVAKLRAMIWENQIRKHRISSRFELGSVIYEAS